MLINHSGLVQCEGRSEYIEARMVKIIGEIW